MNKQRGFPAIKVIAVLVVVAIVAFLAYTYMFQTDKPSSQTPSTQEQTVIQVAPEINTVSDLDESAAVLDSIDPEMNSEELSALEADLAEL